MRAPRSGRSLFVIEAKGDGEADAKMAGLSQAQQRAEQQHMLHALLDERFKLKTHWETKEGDVYYLVVAKVGPKLSAEGSMAVGGRGEEFWGPSGSAALPGERWARVRLYCAWVPDGPVGRDADRAVWAAGDR